MSDAELHPDEETETRRVRSCMAWGFWFNTLPLLIYTVVLFYMGGSPALPMPPSPVVGMDKIVHFGAFGVFALLSHRAAGYQWPALPPRALRGLAALAAVLGGGLLELYQLGFPNRSCEAWDFVADCSGAVVAMVVLWALSRFRFGQRKLG